MKQSILMAFQDQVAQMDSDVQEAVKAMCTPENIAKIIGDQVAQEIKSAIDKEIHEYYAYGNGRRFVKEAVIAHLERGNSERPERT
jgi:hypothetical protein